MTLFERVLLPAFAGATEWLNSEPLGPAERQSLVLIVEDIDATREDVISRDVEVSEVFHIELGKDPLPGPDPERRSYSSLASFSDPHGNHWLLQEATERIGEQAQLILKRRFPLVGNGEGTTGV